MTNPVMHTLMQLTKPGEPTQAAIDATLTVIAHKHLGFHTLEARNLDSLDFKDCACWCVRDALRAAYQAGRADQTAIRPTTTKA